MVEKLHVPVAGSNHKSVDANKTPKQIHKDLVFTIGFKAVTTGWTWVKYEKAGGQKVLPQLRYISVSRRFSMLSDT
jgi:hypothetical protein